MPSRLSNPPNSQAVALQPESLSKPVNLPTLSGSPVVLVETAKLPYQIDHQVELLHLRAEAEALLQQLQTLKQQRLSTQSETVQEMVTV